MTNPSNKEEFKKVLLAKPHAIIGKNGITDQIIEHISNLLKKYKIIKIKALKSIAKGMDIKLIAREVSEKTNSQLLDTRGKIFILSIQKNS